MNGKNDAKTGLSDESLRKISGGRAAFAGDAPVPCAHYVCAYCRRTADGGAFVHEPGCYYSGRAAECVQCVYWSGTGCRK